jgi:chromosome segregation ATPase
MVRLKRGKTVAVLEEESDSVEEEPTETLQKLTSSEADLIEEKKKLASLKEKLRLKIQEEIESKKKNIEKLRAEIVDLKFSCEELTKSLKAQRRNVPTEVA